MQSKKFLIPIKNICGLPIGKKVIIRVENYRGITNGYYSAKIKLDDRSKGKGV